MRGRTAGWRGGEGGGWGGRAATPPGAAPPRGMAAYDRESLSLVVVATWRPKGGPGITPPLRTETSPRSGASAGSA